MKFSFVFVVFLLNIQISSPISLNVIRRHPSLLGNKFYQLNDQFTKPEDDDCLKWNALKKSGNCYCKQTRETFYSYKVGCTDNVTLITNGENCLLIQNIIPTTPQYWHGKIGIGLPSKNNKSCLIKKTYTVHPGNDFLLAINNSFVKLTDNELECIDSNNFPSGHLIKLSIECRPKLGSVTQECFYFKVQGIQTFDLALPSTTTTPKTDTCPTSGKIECGYHGITSQDCTKVNDCCYNQSEINKEPWCFYKTNDACAAVANRQECGDLQTNKTMCMKRGCFWKKAKTGSTRPWCFHKQGPRSLLTTTTLIQPSSGIHTYSSVMPSTSARNTKYLASTKRLEITSSPQSSVFKLTITQTTTTKMPTQTSIFMTTLLPKIKKRKSSDEKSQIPFVPIIIGVTFFFLIGFLSVALVIRRKKMISTKNKEIGILYSKHNDDITGIELDESKVTDQNYSDITINQKKESNSYSDLTFDQTKGADDKTFVNENEYYATSSMNKNKAQLSTNIYYDSQNALQYHQENVIYQSDQNPPESVYHDIKPENELGNTKSETKDSKNDIVATTGISDLVYHEISSDKINSKQRKTDYKKIESDYEEGIENPVYADIYSTIT